MQVMAGQSGPASLAADFTVVARADGDTATGYSYFLSDAFCALPDGSLLAATPMVQVAPGLPADKAPQACTVVVARSRDGGATWENVARLSFPRTVEVALVPAPDRVVLLIGPRSREGLILAAESRDGGAVWGEPVEILRWSRAAGTAPAAAAAAAVQGAVRVETSQEGDHWYCLHQTAMAEHSGRLYVAVSERCQFMAIAVCDLAEGILNPGAWRLSASTEMPIPKELNPGLLPGPSMRCLEGNVIRVDARLPAPPDRAARPGLQGVIRGGSSLRVLARAVIDRYGTSGLAAVFDVEDDGTVPRLVFTQFYPLPGGQCKFFIVYDDASRLYWMASNIPANTQGWVASPADAPLGNDRRFLMLWYACDALNWFPAGCIAHAERLTHSFMYPALIVDGDDLCVLSRTSAPYEGRQAATRAGRGFHDANLLTFHRVRRFRDLAMDIWPRA